MRPSDSDLLERSLAEDTFHRGTEAGFFSQPGTVCNVYEDEAGPVFFLRGSKALRLDMQYVSNADAKRNLKAMLWGFDALVEKARANGFTEIIFNTESPTLRAFCLKRFGFVDSLGELRKLLI